MSCQRICPPLSPIVTEPTVIYNDIYVPQPVDVIHPIEIVNRYHCVPVPRHIVTYTCRDEVTAGVSQHKGKKKRR